MKNVTFLVTNKCNFRCWHCFSNSGLCLEDELTTEEKKETIDKLAELGTERLVYSGGEPTLYNDLCDLIKHAKEKNLRTSILTNGSLITRKFAHRLVNTGLDDLAISVYSQDIVGFSSHIFSQYTQKTIDSVKFMQDERIPCKITYPSDGKNAEFIIDTLSQFYKLGIEPQEIRILIITPIGRAVRKMPGMPNEEKWAAFINKIRSAKEKFADYKINYEINSTDCKEYYQGCPLEDYASNVLSNFQDSHIDANGDIYLCALLIRQKGHCIANIRDDSLSEVSSRILAYGKMIKENQSDKNCDFCPVLNRNLPINHSLEHRLVCPLLYSYNIA